MGLLAAKEVAGLFLLPAKWPTVHQLSTLYLSNWIFDQRSISFCLGGWGYIQQRQKRIQVRTKMQFSTTTKINLCSCCAMCHSVVATIVPTYGGWATLAKWPLPIRSVLLHFSINCFESAYFVTNYFLWCKTNLMKGGFSWLHSFNSRQSVTVQKVGRDLFVKNSQT